MKTIIVLRNTSTITAIVALVCILHYNDSHAVVRIKDHTIEQQRLLLSFLAGTILSAITELPFLRKLRWLSVGAFGISIMIVVECGLRFLGFNDVSGYSVLIAGILAAACRIAAELLSLRYCTIKIA